MLEAGDGHAKVPLWPVPRLKAAQRRCKALKAAQKDVETAEYRRLLYVAMTRARDELYVCGYRGKREPIENCWYNTVRAALKPQHGAARRRAGWRLGALPCWRCAARGAGRSGCRARASLDRARAGAGLRWQRGIAAAPASAAGAGVERGILIHRILQNLPDLPQDRAPRPHRGRGPPRRRRSRHWPHSSSACSPTRCWPTSSRARAIRRLPLIVQGPGGAPERRRLDRLVITPEGILVADYKTDREVPDSPEACNPEYLHADGHLPGCAAPHPARAGRCASASSGRRPRS